MNNRFLQFLGLTKKAGKLVEGYNKCEETIKSGGVHLLILSTDISVNTRDKFIRYCMDRNIKYIEAYSSEVLGASVGRTEIKVLCVTDKQMSDKLMSLYKMLEINRG